MPATATPLTFGTVTAVRIPHLLSVKPGDHGVARSLGAPAAEAVAGRTRPIVDLSTLPETKPIADLVRLAKFRWRITQPDEKERKTYDKQEEELG